MGVADTVAGRVIQVMMKLFAVLVLTLMVIFGSATPVPHHPYHYGYHGYRNDLRQHHVNAIAAASGAGIGTAEVDGVPGTLSGVHPAYGYDPTFGYGAYPYFGYGHEYYY